MSIRRVSRPRLAGVLAAVAAMIALMAIGPVGTARADGGGLDPITGFGNTDSAVTTSWAGGITGKDNKTVVTPRQPKGTNAFVDDMWASYQDLKVTVSKTKNVTHESLQVTWTGGAATDIGHWAGNFLEMMQCYGDATTGPDPEACQWGGVDPLSLPGSSPNWKNPAATRGTSTCPDDPSPLLSGCDPLEPSKPDHKTPGDPSSYTVPFIPVDTDQKIYAATPIDGHPEVPTLGDYFGPFTTNEAPIVPTADDGTGQWAFEAQTGLEASGLGCGNADSAVGGTPRGCWLVIVPRGMEHPNNTPVNVGANGGASDSALSASTWAQRIQIHLAFQHDVSTCPIDTQERPLVGTELVSDAMQSWQPALCANGGSVYTFSVTPDATNAGQLTSSLPGAAGLAFTTTPIEFAGTGPPLVYAPVAITAMTLGFRIDQNALGRFTQVQHASLTPQLLAKALTQSYQVDVPGGIQAAPGWMRTAVPKVTGDAQWVRLNPAVKDLTGSGEPLAPVLTADQSAVNQTVWSWLQADPGTRAWLRGQPDSDGIVINPNYKPLRLGDAPPSTTYPRADPTCYRPPNMPGDAPKDACVTTVDTLPYRRSLEDSAVTVQRSAFGSRSSTWDPSAPAPDGTSGYFPVNKPRPVGRRFTWGLTATFDAARYGLQDMSLCDSSGGGCVTPGTDSLRNAVDAAKPDSSGLLHVDPANPGVGGYPLTEIVYAAVRTDQNPAALRDYAALLDYAAGAGQTPGVNPGQLPPGYLPLPDALRTQAKAVADTLRADAAAQPHAPGSNNPGPTAGSPSGGPSTGTNAANPSGGSSTHPPPANSPHVAGNVPLGSTGQLPGELSAKATPRQSLGALRWALLVVLIAGLVGALAGPMIKRPPRLDRLLRWLP